MGVLVVPGILSVTEWKKLVESLKEPKKFYLETEVKLKKVKEKAIKEKMREIDI